MRILVCAPTDYISFVPWNSTTETRDTQIREQQNKIASLEDAYQDLEGTVTQFREFVIQLQTCVRFHYTQNTLNTFLTISFLSELDTLRAQTQTAQNESATATSQAAAMISLNMKLQSSAAKNQAKNIDLEIWKLDARESKELLSIVQVRSLNLDSLGISIHFFSSPTCHNSILNPTPTPHTVISSSSVSPTN